MVHLSEYFLFPEDPHHPPLDLTPKIHHIPAWSTGTIIKNIKQKSRLWNLYKDNNVVHHWSSFVSHIFKVVTNSQLQTSIR